MATTSCAGYSPQITASRIAAGRCCPCDWPQPIRVDRRLSLDQPVQWEEYTFHFGAMNGHTRFAALIGFEADGKRFAHTGDQYFFLDDKGEWASDFARWDDKRPF